ncbi:MAG TPA: methylated-DNA--[protein]-cysteine S-methyltransferase [Caulobacteraceae bacterium]|jgi:methylated-DNA-[protein]-cysteine S-methyltransferase|nr:methylated-DNA--[protein]-cysteine S-methyltransferase [Caulobacteraceae bacterium]
MTAGPPDRLVFSRLPSPIGTIRLIADEAGRLRWLDFEDQAERMGRLLRAQYGAMATTEGPAPAGLVDALGRYFNGELGALGKIAWATQGTAFQRSVWQALTAIPAGETTTYAALAARIGRPAAVRATGHANGSNPVGIVVPCHRVIGSDGSLTGYGGGLERKRWLLRHEGVDV